MTDTLVDRFLTCLAPQRPGAELDALRTDLDGMGPAQVRATYGILMRQLAEREHPGALDGLAALLDEALVSPLGMIEDRVAVLVTAGIGAQVYPELALPDAAAAMLAAAIVQTPTPPLIQTLLTVSDRQWSVFLRERAHWTKLVWTVPARVRALDFAAGAIDVHFLNPAARYLAPGFWLGLIEAFGLSAETVEIEPESDGWLAQVRWSAR